jgi:hypothetical protein
MMKTIYIVGGQQKKTMLSSLEEWHLCEKGLIMRVDPKYSSSQICVEYITPPEACPAAQDPSIHFRAGTILGTKLYVCTQTEILIYELPRFQMVGYISLPCFNDLHHVCPTLQGSLLVVNTGLDMVLEVTLDGKVLREWNVFGEPPWARFSPDVDYRKILTTKPHQSHPNFVFEFGSNIWVTRFTQKDVMCLTDSEKRLVLGIVGPHDGIVYGKSVYFTTVDGHIVVSNLSKGYIEHVYDLNEMTDTTGYWAGSPLGWCRGLIVVDEEHVIVGFTKIRQTKWRENIRWIKRRFGVPAGQRPTHIGLYDLKNRRICWQMDLQEKGLDLVFSMHTFEE